MRGKLRSAAVGVGVVVAVSAGGAGAEDNERGGFDLAVSSPAPGTSTGLAFRVVYRDPADPEGKAPVVRGASFELPTGMVIDDTAVPQCTATDAELRALGRGACPAASRVGEGRLTATTGFPGVDPVRADIVAFNGPDQIIEAVFFSGTNVLAGIDRLTIEDGRLVAHPPATPGGPPDGRTTIREVRLELPARVGDSGRPYVTTPPDCPHGRWTARAHYEFADGAATTLASESPCRGTPAIEVVVTPRSVPARARRTLKVVARSGDVACVEDATVRVAGRRSQTDQAGRARVKVRFARPGTRQVVVRKPGCRAGRAAVQVRRR